MKIPKLIIRRPDDWHLHLRVAVMLYKVIEFTRHYGRCLIMLNTAPLPILTGADALRYFAEIKKAAGPNNNFLPLMTIQLTEETTPEAIYAAKKAGVIAAKVYPIGQTTNSHNGVRDYENINPALEAMEKCGMVLCLHGEVPDDHVHGLMKEELFLETVIKYSERFPELKIVLEHITSAISYDVVNWLPANVGATITAHHLILTSNDVHGSMMQSHNFCRPVAKNPDDRDQLIKAAISGNPKFFFGSDSAPHSRDKKEAAQCCAGVFSAPVMLQLLAQIFEDNKALNMLEGFTSQFGAEFYGLPLNEGTITLTKERWKVPTQHHSIVPFLAGKELEWQIA